MYLDIAHEALHVQYANMDDSQVATGLKYEEEWSKLCHLDIELTGLRETAMDGGLRASRFRSVIWKLLLGALTPGSCHLWTSETQSSRKHYENLKINLEVRPCVRSEPDRDNPLSQDDESTWHQYFCDKELRSVIRQDVIRTFPGVDFFRNEEIQEGMINILFYYARENPTMCYRQGMHEVLAPILFVVHCDHQALLHTQESSSVRSDIAEVINPMYLEADSYTLFRRIMNAIEGSYLITNVAPTSTGYFPSQRHSLGSPNENQVISQLNWIKERILAPTDPELHSHLEKLDIPLPLFGIRWLRLLFGREFPLQDLLVLWDAIFAENTSFDLVNYIVVAMLVSIRSSLLRSDYTACLTMLMRYPPNEDISCIIEYALHLKNPSQYKMPMKLAFRKKSSSEINGFVKTSQDQTPKLNDLKILPAKRLYQNQNVKQLSTPSYGSSRSGNSIVDGYTLNDPELLLKELRHSHNVMALCQIKLLQYHKILERSVPRSDYHAHQALTGIYELSSLLADNLRKPEKVDLAYEAQEKLTLSPASKPSSPIIVETIKTVRPPSQVDMTVFNHIATPFIDNDQDEVNRMWKSY